MNKYLKSFLQRGIAFAGLGPVVLGIIYVIIESTTNDFSLTGSQVCLGIISTYILAFVQAGATVFNQIEHWSVPKALFFHFSSLYIVYVLSYLINTWIPFEPAVLLIFTLVFVGIYLIIWLSVFISVKVISKKLNSKTE